MTKEDQIMNYLNEKVFGPILSSDNASSSLKRGVNLTKARMNERDAVGMLSYYWSAVIGTERSVGFSAQMKAEGFTRFEEVLEEFRVKFDDKWLRSKP